ncbi:MAG: HAD family hydrolase [Lawsonibacter sp.]
MYFFDLDGTILDSNGIWLDIDLTFLGQHGVHTVPADYTDYVTHHAFFDSAAYTRRYFHLPLTEEEIIAAWHALAQDAYATTLPLKPDVREFLLRANQAGKRCALLTSCMPRLCQAALSRHNLLSLFESVFTTAQLGQEKRDPELYRQVAALCQESPENCILFDDSPVYCTAAQQAGWQVYGVADPIFADRVEEMAQLCGPERFPFSFSSPLP